jgi:hypothetical protein
MGLLASLSDFTASQIFFLIAKFEKTGRVELRFEGEKGEVFFVKGNVTHAKSKGIVGVEALYNLSIFPEGEIEYYPNEKTTEVTIRDEVSTLIGEIEKRKVELNEIQAKLPPFETILVKSPNPPKDAVALRKDDWKILVLMDGKKTIKETVEKSGMAALNVYKTISWFLEKGLVIDPKEVERILGEKVRYINFLIEELATLGINEKEWVTFIKENLSSQGNGKKILENINIPGTKLVMKSKTKIDISKNDIEQIFTKIEKVIQDRCNEEFGPMLAKTKFAAAKAKLKTSKG